MKIPKIPDDFLAETSPEHYATIGRVASSWSAFELMLDEAICAFVGVDREIGACVTSQLPNVARRLDALLSLIKLKNAPEAPIRKLNKFIRSTNELQIKRNGVVHAVWSSGPTTKKNYRLHVTAKGILKFKFEVAELEGLEALLSQINEHKRRLAIFLQSIYKDLQKP